MRKTQDILNTLTNILDKIEKLSAKYDIIITRLEKIESEFNPDIEKSEVDYDQLVEKARKLQQKKSVYDAVLAADEDEDEAIDLSNLTGSL